MPHPAGGDTFPHPTRAKSTSPARAASSTALVPLDAGGKPRSLSVLASPPHPGGNSSSTPGPYAGATAQRSLPKVLTMDYSYMQLSAVADIAPQPPRHGVLCEGPKKGRAGSPSLPPPPSSSINLTTALTLADTMLPEQLAAAVPLKRNPALFYFGDKFGNTGKTDISPDGIAVIKAKGEKYAFQGGELDSAVVNDADVLDFTIGAEGQLVRREVRSAEKLARLIRSGRMYKCTMLRLNNNQLTQLDDLRKVLELRVWKPLNLLTAVDLSFNSFSAIPEELALLPLHTLLLHSNKIATVAEVTKLLALASTLRSLTLHDNPVQAVPGFKADGRTSYRLSVLTQLPFLASLDSTHVTRPEQEQVRTFMQVFLPPKARKLLAPLHQKRHAQT